VDWDSEARQDLLAAVEEETDHLNLLVGNLLNMSRIEAGALKPERNWNSLAEIVSTAMDRTRQQTENHHVQVDVSDDLPLVPVDYFQIEQVLVIEYDEERKPIVHRWRRGASEINYERENENKASS
jgi:two-component system sensor histidine kinase KdpD